MNYRKILLSTVASLAMVSSLSASELELIEYDNGGFGVNTGAADTLDMTAAASLHSPIEIDTLYAGNDEVSIDINDMSDTSCNVGPAANDRSIHYYSSVSLNKNSTLKFAFTGGAIESDATMFLFAKTTNAIGTYLAGDWIKVGTLNDFTNGGAGYSMVQFQITDIPALMTFATADGATSSTAATADVLPAEVQLLIATDDTIDDVAQGTGFISPKIIAQTNGMTATSTVTVDITAKDDNANNLNAPKVSAVTLIDAVDTLAYTVNPAGTGVSTVDVEADPSRTEFTNVGGDASSSTTNSTFTPVLACTAEVGLILGTDVNYELNVTRDNDDNVTTMVMSGITETDATAGTTWSFASDLATAPLALLTINVAGSGVLSTGMWKSTLGLNPVAGAASADAALNLDSFVAASGVDSVDWKINGAQFIVPYLHTSASYGTYVVITNTSDTDAEVNLDVYADKAIQGGQTQAAMACQNVTLATIPANSTSTYYPNDINTAIDGTSGCANFSTTNDRFMGQFTLVAPSNNIHAVAFQKDGVNGKRSIPVYTDSNSHDWNE